MDVSRYQNHNNFILKILITFIFPSLFFVIFSTIVFVSYLQQNFVVTLLRKYKYQIANFKSYGAASSSNKYRLIYNSDYPIMDS